MMACMWNIPFIPEPPTTLPRHTHRSLLPSHLLQMSSFLSNLGDTNISWKRVSPVPSLQPSPSPPAGPAQSDWQHAEPKVSMFQIQTLWLCPLNYMKKSKSDVITDNQNKMKSEPLRRMCLVWTLELSLSALPQSPPQLPLPHLLLLAPSSFIFADSHLLILPFCLFLLCFPSLTEWQMLVHNTMSVKTSATLIKRLSVCVCTCASVCMLLH